MGQKRKKPFTHVSMHKKIKQELLELKETVRIHTHGDYDPSYANVIVFLIKHYKDSLRVEYPLNQKLLVGNTLQNKKLNVLTSITPKPYSASVKLNGKTRASYSVES